MCVPVVLSLFIVLAMENRYTLNAYTFRIPNESDNILIVHYLNWQTDAIIIDSLCRVDAGAIAKPRHLYHNMPMRTESAHRRRHKLLYVIIILNVVLLFKERIRNREDT